ncbi:MAG: hypothetical protein AAGF74_14565 [Pseudomonadota bacterium]
MSLKIRILTGLTTLAVSACSLPSFEISDGATVSRALSGMTVVGQYSDGTSYCEFHDPNGLVVGRDYELFAGNWEIVNDAICYSYPGMATDCQLALISPGKAKFMNAFGGMVAQGSLVSGNVCN